MHIAFKIIAAAVLIITPLTTWWWLYFLLVFVAVFLLNLTYLTIFAGFVLDVIYLGGSKEYPIMTATSMLVVVLFIILKDKLRLENVLE